MDGVEDLLAKGMMSVSSVGGNEGREAMTLEKGFVQGVEW